MLIIVGVIPILSGITKKNMITLPLVHTVRCIENCTVAISNKKVERIIIVHCGSGSGFIKDVLFIIYPVS
jgi:hypothetical protein